MIVSELTQSDLVSRLRAGQLKLGIGPFVVNVFSDIPAVAENIQRLYSHYAISDSDFVDFYINLKKPTGIRRFFRPQVNFDFDGLLPFKPLPYAQSFAMFEWGLNWCVASYAHQYLILHSAVVEKNGVAVIMPGSPGAGKSTLCAGLIGRGWRLLSDEMALISLESLNLVPIPRPVSLKNASIEVIAAFDTNAEFGLIATDTHKGTITHIKPPENSIDAVFEETQAAYMIFPHFEAGSQMNLTPLKKGSAFIRAAEQGFNYNVLGEKGFDVLAAIIDRVETFELHYSELNDAITTFDRLTLSGE